MQPDPHRPQYHFMPPANWMNDPNGLIHWQGRYHMFYQHYPHAAYWHSMHWGHAVSDDLVHWQHLPIALEPTPGGPDEFGCYSGCAVDNNGVPTIIYTGVRGEHGEVQLPCIATSHDNLGTLQKYAGNPVIAAPPADLDITIFRDHSVWREGNTWYQAIGSGIRNVGGAVLLYRSPDLYNWEYLHPLCVGDASVREPFWTGTGWECPQLLRFADGAALAFSVWDNEILYSAYLSGEYADQRFTAQSVRKLDYGDTAFYAPQACVDAAGRTVMWGWMTEWRSREQQIAAGWSGVMSLPRIITLRDDGLLGMAPAPELQALRGPRYALSPRSLAAGELLPLNDLRGDSFELLAEFQPAAAASCGLAVRRSPDGAEQTVIAYDSAKRRLLIDTTAASLDASTRRDVWYGPLELASDEPLQLQIFVDRSAIEVFANGRACISARVYPTRPDSQGVALLAQQGSAEVQSLSAWQLRSIWQ